MLLIAAISSASIPISDPLVPAPISDLFFNNLIFTNCWIYIQGISGLNGDKGDKGLIGSKGSKGIIGNKGADGGKGFIGDKGSNGYIGYY